MSFHLFGFSSISFREQPFEAQLFPGMAGELCWGELERSHLG